jgi:hypothetical protein
MKLLPHLHACVLNTAKYKNRVHCGKNIKRNPFRTSSPSKYLRLRERKRGIEKVPKRKKYNKEKEYK